MSGCAAYHISRYGRQTTHIYNYYNRQRTTGAPLAPTRSPYVLSHHKSDCTGDRRPSTQPTIPQFDPPNLNYATATAFEPDVECDNDAIYDVLPPTRASATNLTGPHLVIAKSMFPIIITNKFIRSLLLLLIKTWLINDRS